MTNNTSNGNEIAIKVEHVGKTFEPQSSARTIKEGFVGLGRILAGKKKLTHHKGEYTALKDISFEVKKGEFIGIVGRNGSGKSTLLKILAGVYTPSKGHVKVNGKLTPFIELGVGFNPELSGRDNVFLNGALLGFTRQQMGEMYDDIVDFAELHDFMDTKLKNYSSGMQVRLAFSIAIRADTDILVLDEVLAVGDEAFQKKCYAYFTQLKQKKKTVILVTHSMEQIQQFCTSAMMIDGGSVVCVGNPSVVAQQYRELFMPKTAIQHKILDNLDGNGVANNDYIRATVQLEQSADKLKFELSVSPKKSLRNDTIVAFGLVRDSGEQVFRWASDEKISENFDFTKQNLEVVIDNIFPEGKFGVLLVVKSRDRSIDYGTFNDILKFDILPRTKYKWDTYWKPREIFKIINKQKEV